MSFKEGDKVLALGDGWITKGSVGIVDCIRNGHIKVKWEVVAEPAPSCPMRPPRIGARLYHYTSTLRLLEHSNDPNIAFLIKRRK